MKNWFDFLGSSQDAMTQVYLQQRVPGPLLTHLAMAGQAFRTLQWYRYVGDSLYRAGMLDDLSAKKRSGRSKLESAVGRIRFDANDRSRPPPRTDLKADVLEWAIADTAFAKDLAELEWHLGYIDPNFFAGTSTPEQLIEDLHALGLFDEWLAEDLRLDLRCGRIYDAAELLILINQRINVRTRTVQMRQERVSRINDLVQAGYLDAQRGKHFFHTNDPYSLPSDLEIAVASSPHVVLDCDERVWTAESYYTQHLPKLAGIVPELAPVDIRVVDRHPDQTLMGATYHSEVNFISNGRMYAFDVFEGRGDVVERPSSGCFLMLLAFKTLNKALCDEGSAYRLVKHELRDDECAPKATKMCVSFIDQARCDIWWPTPQKILDQHVRSDRCPELFRTTFCSDSIAAFVEEINSLGMFRHLTTSRIDSATTRANATMPRAWADVLRHYPDLLAWPGFRNAPWVEGDLKEQLMSISAISQGALTISHIKEHWRTRRRGWGREQRYCAKLSFRVNNRVSIRLKGSEYMSTERFMEDLVMTQLNQACAALDIPGRFCSVDADRHTPVLFLNPSQYNALKDKVLSYYGNPWELPTE